MGNLMRKLKDRRADRLMSKRGGASGGSSGGGAADAGGGDALAEEASGSNVANRQLATMGSLQGNEESILSNANRDSLELPGTSVSRIVGLSSRTGTKNEFAPNEILKDSLFFTHLNSANFKRGESGLGSQFANAADRVAANIYSRASNSTKNDIANPRSPNYNGNRPSDWARVEKTALSPALKLMAKDMRIRTERIERRLEAESRAKSKARAKAAKSTRKSKKDDEDSLSSIFD